MGKKYSEVESKLMETKSTFSVASLEDKVKEIQRREEDNHDTKNRKVGRLEDQSRKL